MAVFARGFVKCFQSQRAALTSFLDVKPIPLQVVRTSYFDNLTHHGENYSYELSKNPEEWKYVERLIPYKVVPKVTKKSHYPSGWQPPTEEAYNHPYYVERSKNHMLPVYLKIRGRGNMKTTIVKNIRGDLWKLYQELTEYLEESSNEKVYSCVLEGNCSITIKGDFVYYCEQWLLSKGF